MKIGELSPRDVVITAPLEVVRAGCSEAEAALRGRTVQPANHNTPDQTVVAGHADAVDRAIAASKARGARRGIRLQVSAPFHCPLMAPVQPRLAEVLSRLEVRVPRAPVVANATAAANADPARSPSLLVEQVTATVRWVECVEAMLAARTELFIECGPGSVLSGLIQRIAPAARAISISDPARLAEALAV